MTKQNVTNIPKPKLLETAEKYLGLAEVKGSRHNSTIQRWLVNIQAWWNDDEQPWCGVAMANWLIECGYKPPKDPYRAKSYETYGLGLKAPCVGAIAVMSRKGGGHVCIVAGCTDNGDLVVIGGNQGDKVSYASYPRSRFTAYRWVGTAPYVERYTLPVMSVKNGVKES